MSILSIGITGGIGAGKSYVAEVFAHLGVPVYNSDDRAKALMVEDQELVNQIKSIFGAEAYFGDQSLNRKHIAKLAFQDQSLLTKLNDAVHPAVHLDQQKWQSKQRFPYCLKEAALIFETKGNKFLDFTILVSAFKKLRVDRVAKRDPQRSRKEILSIIDKQLPENIKKELADFVIYNNEKRLLLPQVIKVHKKLIAAAQEA